jgi:hypothetical protein
MKRLLLVFVFLALSCRGPGVPVNTMLWRIDTPWVTPAGRTDVRTAQATIITFRANQEYVEFHTPVIEQNDATVYLQSGRPRGVAIGRWELKGSEITATRQKIARTGARVKPGDPLCVPVQLKFRTTGKSVTGNAGGTGNGSYTPITRLVAPDIESYVEKARDSPVSCPGSEP